MTPPGRKPAASPGESKRLSLNQSQLDYLQGIALTGIHGNSWTDVAKKFIGDGIAQALRDRVIPRAKTPQMPYVLEDGKGE
jgi:hypothetical protein